MFSLKVVSPNLPLKKQQQQQTNRQTNKQLAPFSSLFLLPLSLLPFHPSLKHQSSPAPLPRLAQESPISHNKRRPASRSILDGQSPRGELSSVGEQSLRACVEIRLKKARRTQTRVSLSVIPPFLPSSLHPPSTKPPLVQKRKKHAARRSVNVQKVVSSRSVSGRRSFRVGKKIKKRLSGEFKGKQVVFIFWAPLPSPWQKSRGGGGIEDSRRKH